MGVGGRGLAIEDPEHLLPALQRRMREAEADLADELVADGALVVRDGPLNRFYGINVEVAGLVKSHYQAYFPPDIHRRVPAVLAAPGSAPACSGSATRCGGATCACRRRAG